MSSTMSEPDVEATPATERPRSRAPRVLAWIAGIVLILLGLVALLWTVARSTDSVSESFTGDIQRMAIEVTGRVMLQAGDTLDVTVEREWVLTGAPDVEMVEDGGTLRVDAECGFLQWGCQTHVTATAPAGTELVVETAAGNVTVSGFENGVDLTTSAGNVILEGVSGPAVLRSSAGRIEGDVTDGDVDAETSAGRIELDVRGEFTSVSAVTSAGNVSLTLPDETYRVDADTSAGSVEVNVATDPDADRQIVARSSAGSIRIDRSGG